jgi:hypothetical protein
MPLQAIDHSFPFFTGCYIFAAPDESALFKTIHIFSGSSKYNNETSTAYSICRNTTVCLPN